MVKWRHAPLRVKDHASGSRLHAELKTHVQWDTHTLRPFQGPRHRLETQVTASKHCKGSPPHGQFLVRSIWWESSVAVRPKSLMWWEMVVPSNLPSHCDQC